MWWLTACVYSLAPEPTTTTPTPTSSPTGSTAETGDTPIGTGPSSDEFDEDAGWWLDIGDTDPQPTTSRVASWTVSGGELRLRPEVSTWFGEYRGAMMYQEVHGDFLVVAHFDVRNGAGQPSPPSRLYSLAGLMAREPYDGLEDWIWIAAGTGEDSGLWSNAFKRTTGDVSSPSFLWDADTDGAVDFAIVRIGDLVAALRQEVDGQGWTVRAKDCAILHSDLLEVGIAADADFAVASSVPVTEYDQASITGGTADVEARVDYVRFSVPPTVADPCGTFLGTGTNVDQELVDLLGLG